MEKLSLNFIPKLLLTVILFFIFSTSNYAADLHYLQIANTTSESDITDPNTGKYSYIGKDHDQWDGRYAVQDVTVNTTDGYLFTGWTGDIPDDLKDNVHLSLVMNGDYNITANFEKTKHFKIETRGYIRSAPLLYDINKDGNREIIVGDMAGYVYCFDHSGALLWEYYAGDAFDVSTSPIPEWFNRETRENTDVGNMTIQSSPAAGDIDGDGYPEIVVGTGGFVDAHTWAGGGTTSSFGPVGQGGILILGHNGKLKLLIRGWDTYDGLGNPIQDGFSDGFYSTPALADLDKDGRLDLVIGGTDQNIYALKAVKHDTSNVNCEKVYYYHPPGKNSLWMVPIYEFDDDGDGKFNEDPVGECTPLVYYFQNPMFTGYENVDDDGDGYVDEGTEMGIVGDDDEDAWPQKSFDIWSDVDEDEFEWPFRNTDTVVSSPAIADINGDGSLEIIIGADSAGGGPLKASRKKIPPGGAIRVMDFYGNEVDSFPQWIEQVVYSTPTVGDINGDGKLEILHGTGTHYKTESDEFKGKGVYVWNSDGTPYLNPLNKNPGDAGYGLFAATDHIVWGAPTFGDLNGDGSVEIVAGDFSGYVYAWNNRGELLPGFPVLPLSDFPELPGPGYYEIRSSPILVDVDNDLLPEIITGAGWSIVGINGDGTLVPSFKYGHTSFTTGTSSVFATPAVSDLDNNGKADLVWVTGDSSESTGMYIDHGVIHVWEVGDYNRDASPWPMFKRMGVRTSNYSLGLENPIMEFFYFSEDSKWITISIDVDKGPYPVVDLDLEIDIGGELYRYNLSDDGADGDLFEGDGRYTTGMFRFEGINISESVTFLVDQGLGISQEYKFIFNFSGPQIESNISKYYVDILDRLPESNAEKRWRSSIEKIVNLGIDVNEGFIALAKLFLNSEEYIGKHKTNSEYIIDLYEAFFNRTPSNNEIAYWCGFLEDNLSRNVIMNYFVYSNEFEIFMEDTYGVGTNREECNLINDFYRGFMNRLPDSGGFNGWLSLMREAQCKGAGAVKDLSHSMVLGFITSPEYINKNRSNREYVEDLYNGILRRGAMAPEFDYWVDFLVAGTYSRKELLVFFTASIEFQGRVQRIIDIGCF